MLKNNIFELSSNFDYLHNIWFLDLKFNKIKFISDTFIYSVKEGGTIKWLDLSDNKLARIPSSIQELAFLEKIWLDGNPFHCDCEMTWMIDWLNNFTGPDGEHKIVNYDTLACQQGIMKDMPIHLLKVVHMGCFPSKWTMWQKVSVGVGSGLAGLVIIILSVAIIKRSRDIIFFLYYYCKWCTCFGVPKDDKNEKLKNIEYDAFLYYRLVFL